MGDKMKDKKEMLLSVLALVAFTGLTAWLTSAYINQKVANDGVLAASTTVSADINAGTLSLTASSSVSMSAINLNSIGDAGSNSTGSISEVKVSDHRSTAPGWSVTATCSDFTDGGSNSIDITNLTVTPGTVSAVGNSSLTGVSAGGAHTYTGTSDPATMMTATTGNGRGRFTQDTDLSLFVDVSTVPASYSATMTETVS
ncbi:WxL domain-containing protein [Patescibacteria group bacterium]|nr:WxL domain-containing protein [Patescibacteria group bacterium]